MGAWAYVEQASPQMLIVESGVYWSDQLRTVVSASYTGGAPPRPAAAAPSLPAFAPPGMFAA